jgi:hypothetical protein
MITLLTHDFGAIIVRETAKFSALFTPFTLAGKRLRNRIAHASMSLLATPSGRVTERFVQYHSNRAAAGAAMKVTEPLCMMRHQAGLPRVQVWRRNDADGLKPFAEAVGSGLLVAWPNSGCGTRPFTFPDAISRQSVPLHCRTICRGQRRAH